MTERIALNVGGTVFETTKSTLIRSPYFAAMLNGDWPIEREETSGAIKLFLDRDPQLFDYALKHMRGYPIDFAQLEEVLRGFVEAELLFFGLSNSPTLLTQPEPEYKLIKFKFDARDQLFELTQDELELCRGGEFYHQLTNNVANENDIVTLNGFKAARYQCTKGNGSVGYCGWCPTVSRVNWFEFVVDVVKCGGDGAVKMHLIVHEPRAEAMKLAFSAAKKLGIPALVKAIVDVTVAD